MQADSSLTSIAHVIQLAVAPVFLIAGEAAFLNVLTNRLGRVIDRGRAIAERPISPTGREELELLRSRAKYVNRSIACTTLSALLIVTVIILLFLGDFLAVTIAVAVGSLFVAAMLVLLIALILFFLEIQLATATLRFMIPHDPDLDLTANAIEKK